MLSSLSLPHDISLSDRICIYAQDRDELLERLYERYPQLRGLYPSALVENVITDVCHYFISERPLPKGQVALCSVGSRHVVYFNSRLADFVDSEKVNLEALRCTAMAHELGHVRSHQDEMEEGEFISYQEDGVSGREVLPEGGRGGPLLVGLPGSARAFGEGGAVSGDGGGQGQGATGGFWDAVGQGLQAGGGFWRDPDADVPESGGLRLDREGASEAEGAARFAAGRGEAPAPRALRLRLALEPQENERGGPERPPRVDSRAT